jgi:hypothetical protein
MSQINRANFRSHQGINPVLRQAPTYIIESMNEARRLDNQAEIPFKGIPTDRLKGVSKINALRHQRSRENETPLERVRRLGRILGAKRR